jgi:hypothetical protein
MKMLTNKEIKEIAMRQSAEDIGCKAEDFLSEKNIICKNCERAVLAARNIQYPRA